MGLNSSPSEGDPSGFAANSSPSEGDSSRFAAISRPENVLRRGRFGAVRLSYWAFVRYYERRAVRELSLPWRWILEEGAGTRWAAAGSAVIFSVAHLANNDVRWVTLLSVTLAGLIWTCVFIVSRNLWVAAAHHSCWNATIFLIGLPLSGENWRALAPLVTVSHGSILWTGGAFGPEDSLVNVAVSAVICAALWRLAERRGRVSAAGPVDPAGREDALASPSRAVRGRG